MIVVDTKKVGILNLKASDGIIFDIYNDAIIIHNVKELLGNIYFMVYYADIGWNHEDWRKFTNYYKSNKEAVTMALAEWFNENSEKDRIITKEQMVKEILSKLRNCEPCMKL